VVELHGTAHRCRCLGCPAVWDSSAILDRVAGGDDDPHCEHCGSIIKVAVISFGEEMPTTAMHRALTAADDCDAVISAGSTLSVYPAADVPLRAAGRHAPYIIINRGETAHDRLADVVIDGDVTSVLPALVEGLT
jgi:NAD-dependent deacetylase